MKYFVLIIGICVMIFVGCDESTIRDMNSYNPNIIPDVDVKVTYNTKFQKSVKVVRPKIITGKNDTILVVVNWKEYDDKN